MGQLDKAERIARRPFDLSPDACSSHGLLSQIYIAQGRPQDALPENRASTVRCHPVRFLFRSRTTLLVAKKESDGALSEYVTKYHADGAYQIALVYAFRNQSTKHSSG